MPTHWNFSAEARNSVGMRLGGLLTAGDVICLQGELGSGKTTFVQGLAQGWGSMDAVSSPTFILVNIYRRADGAQLFHLDGYRLNSVPEAEELDLDSMLTQGALLIEWPERMDGLIPDDRLWIHFEYMAEEHRQMILKASGKRYEALLAGIHKTMFGAG
jgi:tRNA threonylcarbamoyladenosine biosynthesis protein TsaE